MEPTTELPTDLRDTKGRLQRLAIAATVALVVTALVMHWINSVSRAPNADPVGASTVPLLAIAMFVVTTALGAGLLGRFARRQ
jgi:negative regulator of sigma E activity